jgi:hypothetical protein
MVDYTPPTIVAGVLATPAFVRLTQSVTANTAIAAYSYDKAEFYHLTFTPTRALASNDGYILLTAAGFALPAEPYCYILGGPTGDLTCEAGTATDTIKISGYTYAADTTKTDIAILLKNTLTANGSITL